MAEGLNIPCPAGVERQPGAYVFRSLLDTVSDDVHLLKPTQTEGE